MGWKLAVSYSDLEGTDMDMYRLVRRQALDTGEPSALQPLSRAALRPAQFPWLCLFLLHPKALKSLTSAACHPRGNHSSVMTEVFF